MEDVASDPWFMGVEIVKGVMPVIHPYILQWRKRTDSDQWDEMWEGVLHMPPLANRTHRELEGRLETWLRVFWVRGQSAKVYHQINITPPGGWPDNYRIPDLVLLTPDRFDIDRNEYFEGAPAVVVEIHSPGDEAFEKLPFYAELGVPEVWIIDRDTKLPEVHVLRDNEYQKRPVGKDGWIRSEITGILLRGESNGKLAIQLADDPETRCELPER